jgi:hypothetical protein
MNNIEDFSVSLPITTTARNTAQRFASQQSSPDVAERVRRNTLSVLVMDNYLEMMGITTNLEASDSWHPVVRLCADVADLEIDGFGKLECRSLQAGESTCYMPPEVWEDRIGYTVLRLEEDGRSATILGFVKKVSTEYLALDRLEPIENLCEALQAPKPVPLSPISIISDWFQGLFDAGWQELETLLVNPQPQVAWGWRSENTISIPSLNQIEVRRGKAIDLSTYLPNCKVALVVTTWQETENKTNIRLAVYPITGMYLPQFLKLVVLDETGNVFKEIESRSIDNFIQFEFNGDAGEHFSAQVIFAEFVVTENFVI